MVCECDKQAFPSDAHLKKNFQIPQSSATKKAIHVFMDIGFATEAKRLSIFSYYEEANCEKGAAGFSVTANKANALITTTCVDLKFELNFQLATMTIF